MKTPHEIAAEVASSFPGLNESFMGVLQGWIVAGIEKDRAQRQPEIYIVQDEGGYVLDIFRAKEEAERYLENNGLSRDMHSVSIICETVWESGEYDKAARENGWIQ